MQSSSTFNIAMSSHPQLVALIDYYYFYEGEATEHNDIEFIHFPHFKHTLNCFQNADIQLSEFTRKLSPSGTNKYTSVYHRYLSSARKAVIQGPFSVIGIVLHPLAIYHFMADNLAGQGKEFVFTQFGDAFQQLIHEVFNASLLAEKAALLDQFFSDQYRDIENQALIKAVNQIIAHKGDCSLENICQELGINRRTLHRYFNRYLDCSYRDFKTVVKFRYAFDQYFQSDQPQKLSELAYWANYYDQSDFINHFKTKTNATPKELLQTIKPMSDQKILWKFSS